MLGDEPSYPGISRNGPEDVSVFLEKGLMAFVRLLSCVHDPKQVTKHQLESRFPPAWPRFGEQFASTLEVGN